VEEAQKKRAEYGCARSVRVVAVAAVWGGTCETGLTREKFCCCHKERVGENGRDDCGGGGSYEKIEVGKGILVVAFFLFSVLDARQVLG
jgi:hypothetical protein